MRDRDTPLDGIRVLVVEDEYYLADDLSRTLVGAGAEVVGPVSSLEDAQEKVDERRFECAILDMNLRGDFAFPIAEKLQQESVPFVIATGYNQASLPKALTSAPRIEKPFSPHQIVEVLTRLK